MLLTEPKAHLSITWRSTFFLTAELQVTNRKYLITLKRLMGAGLLQSYQRTDAVHLGSVSCIHAVDSNSYFSNFKENTAYKITRMNNRRKKLKEEKKSTLKKKGNKTM